MNTADDCAQKRTNQHCSNQHIVLHASPVLFRARRAAHRLPLSSSGSLAIFAAIGRASSLVSSLAADSAAWFILEIDISERLSVVVAHDKTRGLFLNRPRRRKATCHQVPSKDFGRGKQLFGSIIGGMKRPGIKGDHNASW